MYVAGLGARVSVDIGTHIDAAVFRRAWSRCLAAGSDEAPVAVGPRATMADMTQGITRALIDGRRGDLLMFHAGAVCHPGDGRSLAFVAPGGTGKTTLAARLGRRYGYLTDETVGVDPDTLGIEPYEKPLSIRSDPHGQPKTEVGPDALGLVRARPAATLTTLCVIRRLPAQSRAHAQKLGLADALIALAPQISSLSALPQPLHLLADVVNRVDGCWDVRYSEAAQLDRWATARLELS